MNLSLTGSQISPNRRSGSSRPSSTVSKKSENRNLCTNEYGNEPKRPSSARINNSSKINKHKSSEMAMKFPKSNSKKSLFSDHSRPGSARSTKSSNLRPRSSKISYPSHSSTQSSKEYLTLFGDDLPQMKSIDTELSITGSWQLDDLETKDSIKIPVMEKCVDKDDLNENNENRKLNVVKNVNSKPPSRKSRLEQRERSAIVIQKWYRRHWQRKKASSAAVKRILSAKKKEMETAIFQQKEKEKHFHRNEEEKKKRRENQAREARLRAIEELKKSRELKMDEEIKVVKEEMEMIKEKQVNKLNKQTKNNSVAKEDEKLNEQKVVETVDQKIENIFNEVISDSKSDPDEDIKENIEEAKTSYLSSLLKTIEELEAPAEELQLKDSSKFDEKLSWIDEIQSNHFNTMETRSVTSQKHTIGADGDSSSAVDENILLTKAKMENIMSFLDNVEKKDLEYEASKSQVSNGEEATKKFVESAKAATAIESELMKLRMDVGEKNRSIDLLKKAVSQQKELTMRHIKSQDTEMEQRLKMQKEQYESTIQRHLSFINQLIDDKKDLTSKCQRMLGEIKTIETKYQDKIKRMEESQSVEMKKSKEVLAAAEKLRREKWISEKTRAIKEMTVKGLEPEIQRLIGKHKQEVKKISAIHEAELLQSDERAAQRYIKQTEELRDQLEREKEDACTRERELIRQRFEKQLEHEEMSLQQQRRRLYQEVAEEKERVNIQATKHRKELEESKLQLEDANRRAMAALTEEYNKSKEEASRRHTEEMKMLEDRLDVEKQAWMEQHMKRQEGFILQKERQFKEALRKDRDSEIERVILQLEKDMTEQKSQVETTAENRVKRVREKYESELKEVELMERQTQAKYNSMKVKLSDLEGENMRFASAIKQKEQELTDVTHVKQKLVEERGNVADVVRDEFAERLVYLEDENSRMKNDVAQSRSRHKLEIDRINREKEEELAEVHKRVKSALVKKEESMKQMKTQFDAAVKRADHLEELLEQQRKQLVGIKKR